MINNENDFSPARPEPPSMQLIHTLRCATSIFDPSIQSQSTFSSTRVHLFVVLQKQNAHKVGPPRSLLDQRLFTHLLRRPRRAMASVPPRVFNYSLLSFHNDVLPSKFNEWNIACIQALFHSLKILH